MSYNDELASIAKQPFTYIKIELDYCAESFGAGACAATGEECFNTRHTCKYPSAFNKTTKNYHMVSAAIANLPRIDASVRPYIASVAYMPTEIKDTLTVKGRVKMTFIDEDDDDIGIDPYVSSRSTINGTYWKKLLARNPYYYGRNIFVYDGFIPLSDPGTYYISSNPKWQGVLDNIIIDRDNKITLEAVDILNKLSDIEIPRSIDSKVMADVTTAATQITVNNATELTGGGSYFRINNEIMSFASVDTTAMILYGVERGLFGTEPSCHETDDKISMCKHYSSQSPYSVLTCILGSAASFDATSIDTTAFTDCSTWAGVDRKIAAMITRPTKLDKLYNEILELVECKSWVGEDLRVTIKKNIANRGGRSYVSLNDSANIIENTGQVDLNAESRISRCALYWDIRATCGQDLPDDPKEYNRIDAAIDYDSESSVEYNSPVQKTIYSRWLQTSVETSSRINIWAKNIVCRKIARNRDPQVLIDVAVETKDSTIKTGSYVKLTTDEMLDIYGNSMTAKCQVIKREVAGDSKVRLRLQKMNDRPIAIMGSTSLNGFTSASTADKEYGFIGSTDAQMSDGSPCYRIY